MSQSIQNSNKNQSLYDLSAIRTSNMRSDGSTAINFKDSPSLTQQQFAKECDINYIVKQNEATGLISHINQGTAQFEDLGDATDYKSALDYLIEAQTSFGLLPAEVRARFKNDPAQLLDFVQNQDNYDEALKLGLVNPRPQPDPEPEPVQKTPPKRRVSGSEPNLQPPADE